MKYNDNRPDPDKLLAALHAEQKKYQRGRLRVFLGMSPGVGKTFAMLEAAQGLHHEGVEVFIAVVETHGRQETMDLLQGLNVIPKKRIEYRGVSLEEMDLDAVLAQKPKLVLIDELAHTNAPGSRHHKRYQDITEILDAGIDVYTTVNVQHLESRKELVEQITNVPVRETVPDSILEMADQIEVIDITPDELLKRLKEGKVYLGERAQRAAQNFFKPDTLTALRELALRFVAEKVDQELKQFISEKQTAKTWKTNDRLMVAISHSPHSERLIRATRRLAYNLNAPWIAIYVDSGTPLDDRDQAQLHKNINLARELKAEVVTTLDTNIYLALRRVAKQKNITQLIVGRPINRGFKNIFQGRSFLDQLVHENNDIDVHVVQQEDPKKRRRTTALPLFDFKTSILSYWFTIWLFVGLGLISAFLEPYIGYRAVGYILLLGVIATGMMAKFGPTMLSGLLSALIWNFFFIPPRFTFFIHEPEDIMISLVYFLVATILGYLTSRIRIQGKMIREREDYISFLYEISQDIAGSKNKTDFLEKINARVREKFNGECRIMLRSAEGRLQINDFKPYSPYLKEKEKAVATWAFESGRTAGWSTDTLSNSKSLYIPLKGHSEVVGLLVFRPFSKRKLSLEQENLLYSTAFQVGVSLERYFIEKRIFESKRLEESEKLHQTILSSISHEMRTPLTSILVAASALGVDEINRNPLQVKNLSEQLMDSGDRLNRVVENLLDMTRLSSGVLALKREWQDIHDLVGVTLRKNEKNLARHHIEIELPDDLPLVLMDFRLIEHALSNLLINAVTYSPPGTQVKISAKAYDKMMHIEVEDEGPGIPAEHKDKVFEKFFRLEGTPAGGTGLGLSIVKSIVEVHHGKVFIKTPETSQGACFVIELPIDEAPEVQADDSL